MSAIARACILLLCATVMACGQRGTAPTATPGGATSERREAIVVLLPALPNTLDPWAASPELAASFMFNVYDTLTQRDRSFAARPGLASEWRSLDDLTWEFTIRTGAKTHAGEVITAALVARSLERSRTVSLSSEDVRSWPVLDGVDSISASALSDRIVRIRTLWPMPELPARLSEAPIAGSDADPTRSTTGALRVTGWTPGQRLELESWAEHWSAPSPARKLTFIPERQAADRFSRLQRGEADIIAELDPADWSAAKSGPTTEETAVLGPRVLYLGLIPRDASSLLARREVRLALGSALDLDGIGERVFAGHTSSATDLLPATGPSGGRPTADPEGARARLAQLGASGSTIELMAPEGRFVRDAALADELARALMAAGVQVQRTRVGWSQVTSGIFSGAQDRVYLGAWENRLYDPTLGYPDLVSSFPGLEVSARQSFLDAVTGAQRLADAHERAQALMEVRRIARDSAPAIPLFQAVDLYGTRRGLKWQARNDQRILLADMAF